MKIINIHIMKNITFSILFVWLSLSLWAARQPEFSTAGFSASIIAGGKSIR